jgi:hypothetical protein
MSIENETIKLRSINPPLKRRVYTSFTLVPVVGLGLSIKNEVMRFRWQNKKKSGIQLRKIIILYLPFCLIAWHYEYIKKYIDESNQKKSLLMKLKRSGLC